MRSLFGVFGSTLLILSAHAADLRLGLVGLDTSHVTAFTSLFNDSTHKNYVPGGKVVVAYKGGSPDIPDSIGRVEGYTRELESKWGVRIVGSVEEVCAQTDAVLITSVDGRPHLDYARRVIAAGKPVFIDKPVAGSLAGAVEIFRLAGEKGVPVFTSSSYRYYDSIIELTNTPIGEVRSAISYGPGPIEPHHPDLFWYGIHPAEALFTVMGPGCERVVRMTSDDTDVVTGYWKGGRIGVLHTRRSGPMPHQVTLFGTKAVATQKSGNDDYAPLLRQVMKFFQTGVPPVSADETLNLFAFMEAADECRRRGGQVVEIQELMTRAQPDSKASKAPAPK